MAFQYLHNTPINEALSSYISTLKKNGLEAQSEILSVDRTLGRTTFAPVYAKISAPHYHASAMDGIAVHASETFGASATTPVKLNADQYVVVDTGDAMPKNFDAVVMVEDVIFESEDEAVIRKGNCNVEIAVAVSP